MKRDLQEVVELFKKSFSSSLTADEERELERVLQQEDLRKIYEQLEDETFVADKFREFEEYEYKPAFENLRRYRRRLSVRRWMWGCSSAAAVFVLMFILFFPDKGSETGMQHVTNVAEQVIPAGSKAAILKLADGRTVRIGQEPMDIREAEGSVVRYEGGLLSYSSDTSVSEVLFNELEVPVGGECFVCLDDGTEIWLNAGSKLRYPVAFAGRDREVTLEGEAYFNVKKDSRAFIVKMQTGDVTVLGTSFGISAYAGEDNYTTLVTGKVRFRSKDDESVVLNPGEQAVVTLNGELEKRTVDVEEYVGWKDGVFVFKEKALSEIMNVLERWYGVKVVFEDESLKDLEYTGSLERYDSINVFLQILERLKEIRYEIKENTVVLFK